MKTTSLQTKLPKGHTYTWLGRHVMALHPEVAKSIFETYYDAEQRPHDADLSNITRYFDHFCTLRSLDRTRQTGRQDNAGHSASRGGSDERNLFIACMVSLYRPAYFRTVSKPLPIKDHLPTAIAQVLRIHRTAVARKMQQVVFWGQELDEFQLQVEQMVAQLKTFNPIP